MAVTSLQSICSPSGRLFCFFLSSFLPRTPQLISRPTWDPGVNREILRILSLRKETLRYGSSCLETLFDLYPVRLSRGGQGATDMKFFLGYPYVYDPLTFGQTWP